jgi:hypothetical protein
MYPILSYITGRGEGRLIIENGRGKYKEEQ